MRLLARKPGEAGAVTAEVAMVLPVLLAVVLLVVWAVGAVITNIRCIDAARDTARAVARGEPPDAARRLGERSAPTDASIKIRPEGDDVQVVVTATVRWPVVDVLPSITTTAQATMQVEPGAFGVG